MGHLWASMPDESQVGVVLQLTEDKALVLLGSEKETKLLQQAPMQPLHALAAVCNKNAWTPAALSANSKGT